MATDIKTEWWIWRDGFRLKGPYDTENKAWEELHKVCPHSWDHAIKYEGYEVKEWTRKIWIRPDAIHPLRLKKKPKS
tara:strand:- start:479 stop:709 length:231 start_codon:yes stop_codon:yes gene_type:complete